MSYKSLAEAKTKRQRAKVKARERERWRVGQSEDVVNARKMGKEMHCGLEQPRLQAEVLGHSLVRSLVRSHSSLVRLLRTARFARALCCAHSFACSLTSLTPSLVGK